MKGKFMKLLRISLIIISLLAALLLGSCASSGGTLGSLADSDLTKLTAIEMTRVMGHGINLGNTMEACNNAERFPMRDPGVYETMWGQPITTQASIDGMKAAGFSTLRIPVAWTNAMNFAVDNALDYENWDFTINPAYLDRVEEIINYALNAGMIVVVNNHWDHGWWSMFGHPEQEIRDLAMEIYISMWTQIAERYNHFDARVILEAANEELGNRLNDRTAFSPTGGTLSMNECYEMTTKINQTFIDTVRATGGNNAERFLLVKGYNTDVMMTMDNRFVMPADSVKDKLILGVHYYTPWAYCGDTSGVGGWGTTSEVEEMNDLLGRLTKFTEQGYGILLGEWGVLDNVGIDRYNYFFNFLNLADKYGYATTLWDTGGVYCRAAHRIAARNNDDDAIDKIAELFKSMSLEARRDMTIDEIIEAAEANLALSLEIAENRPQFVYTADEAFAWIMYASGDWSVQYSVGDQYRPDNKPGGLVVTDVEVTGPGTYTVGLDFTGTQEGFANGFEFAAVGIVNAEILWPGYIMELTEVLINGEPAEFKGFPYTTNDNPVTTRVNLYNHWVGGFDDGEWHFADSPPSEARVPAGINILDASPEPLYNYRLTNIETLVITFDYYEG
jgi:endoglucanase